VGYGPKVLARVAPLRRLVALGEGASVTRALEAGYASQAHMNEEVRRLTGTTPVRFLKDAVLPAPSPSARRRSRLASRPARAGRARSGRRSSTRSPPGSARDDDRAAPSGRGNALGSSLSRSLHPAARRGGKLVGTRTIWPGRR
jgi:hypothetical protein